LQFLTIAAIFFQAKGSILHIHRKSPIVNYGVAVLSVAVALILDSFGEPVIGYDAPLNKLMILHDITNLKHTEAELSRKHQEIQRLSSELLTAQEDERMRISRELHDELGQALTLIKLKIGLVDMRLTEAQLPLKIYCHDASKQVDEAIENMRRLSRDLSPVTIDTLGITIALRRLVEDFDRASNIQIAANIESIDQLLSTQHGILLYRVLQEALNNIVKHSEANTAGISIRRKGDRIQFELKDNGKGLGTQNRSLTKKPGKKGLGMTIMSERVRTLGGSLEILSAKNGGTKLCFEIPVRQEKIEDDKTQDISGG
jgi:signal transduction histidine kinase